MVHGSRLIFHASANYLRLCGSWLPKAPIFNFGERVGWGGRITHEIGNDWKSRATNVFWRFLSPSPNMKPQNRFIPTPPTVRSLTFKRSCGVDVGSSSNVAFCGIPCHLLHCIIFNYFALCGASLHYLTINLLIQINRTFHDWIDD